MNNRLRLLALFIGALIVGVVFSFPFWQPLFVTETVDESFPGLTSEQQQVFEQLAPEKQAAYEELIKTDPTMAAAMAQAATAPDAVVPTEEQSMPQANNPTILANGQFTEIDAIHGASGIATIYQLPDNSRILRFEDFRVTNGPDLHVFLTRNGAPVKPDEIGTDYVDLGRLKGNVGNQNYTIPNEVDFGVYKGVVIYCVQFGALFSTVDLG